MKHYPIYIAIALLCGCTNIQEMLDEAEEGEEVKLSVSISDLPSRGNYILESNSLKCYWEAGDSISVVSLHDGSVATVDLFTAEDAGRTARFSGRYNGSKTDPVLAIYPALTGNQREGYHMRTLTGNQTGMCSIEKGGSTLSFSAGKAYFFSQMGNGSLSHIPLSDIMTGTVDINTDGGNVSMDKHTSVLKLTLSIPTLPSTEKIQSLTLTTSAGTPFIEGPATLSLTSPGSGWSTESPTDTARLYFGNLRQGVFTGFTCPGKTLTAYMPVLPNTSAALQGDTERSVTVTVKTDLSIYSGVKVIPAKSGSEYSFALDPGTLSMVNATLARTGDADPELTKWVSTINSVADVDVEADKLRNDILNSSSLYTITGNTYYVSAEGSDDNNGLSPAAAVKTLTKVNSLNLKPGDGVLFRRGDLWRGTVTVKDGVTYSAYGEGAKPRIYNSIDVANTGSWSLTNVANVYKYSTRIPHSQDVGTLVFNDGADGCAYKVVPRKDYQGNTWHPAETSVAYTGWQDLKRDLDMYHDPSTGYLFLCSTSGNPATRWASIEAPMKGNTFNGYGSNWISCVIDNICIKYTGSHGVGTGHVNSLVVTNCEIGWIGGSLQNDNHEKAPSSPGQLSRIVRYGNGVEIWGVCNEFKVAHNYIYQVYDAAITPQFSTDGNATDLYMDNMSFTDNLIERSVYAIEYWLSVPDEYLEVSGMRNYLIRGNIMRMSGDYGWGFQRFNQDSPAIIKTWNNKNRALNFRMEGNIIDRGNPTLLNIKAGRTEWLPQCRANVYLQQQGVSIGDMIEENPKLIYVN